MEGKMLAQILIQDGIPTRSDRTYFNLEKVCKKYMSMSSKKFRSEYEGVSLYTEKGRKTVYISAANLLPCIKKSGSDKAKALLVKINEMINDSIKKIIDPAKAKAIDGKISMHEHIDYINKKIIEDSNIIPPKITGVACDQIILELISANDSEFMEKTKCPPHTHAVFEKLSIPLFKLVHDGKVSYYIRHAIMLKYFSDCQFLTRVIDLDTSIINDRGAIETPRKSGSETVIFDDEPANDKVKIDDMKKFNSIDENFFADIKKMSSKNPFIYSLQRQLWPEDENYFKNVTNRFEFEILHNIIMKTSHVFYFNFQKIIGSHRVDALLYRKGTFTKTPQTICVEVDENNHRYRDPNDDKLKSEYIKTCGYALFRIPININSSLDKVKLIADETAKNILDFTKKDVILRSPELVYDSIKKNVMEESVHEDFIKLFFDEKSNKTAPFIYAHTKIGKYLGYSPLKNYETLKEMIRENYKRGADYIEIIENDETMIYVTPLTFNHICIQSPQTEKIKQASFEFCVVYRLSYEYLTILIEMSNDPHIHQYANDEIVMQESNKISRVNNLIGQNSEQDDAKDIIMHLREENERMKVEMKLLREQLGERDNLDDDRVVFKNPEAPPPKALTKKKTTQKKSSSKSSSHR